MTEQNKEIGGLHRFYELTHEVSARLVGARSAEIDAAIDDCLAKIGEYFGASQVGWANGQLQVRFCPPYVHGGLNRPAIT